MQGIPNSNSVYRSPDVVRRPSTPTTSTSGAVSGAVGKFVPPVLPTISARDIQPMGGYPVPDIGRFIKKYALPLMVLAITVMAYLQEKATTEGSAAMPRSTAMGQPEQILSGALMLLGIQNPELILFTAAVAFLAQAPGAAAASTHYQNLPAWVASCNVPAYGKTGMIECQLNTQLTEGYSLMVAGGIPGHGIFSLPGQLPYASPNRVATTIPIPPSGQVKIDMSKPVEPFTATDKAALDALVALDDCSRKHMPEYYLCLVPKDAGPDASLGYDYTGKIKNPFNIVDPRQLADKLNGPSGPKCATVYRPTDPSVPGTTVRVGDKEAIVINSCGVAVGPGGPLSPRNVEVLPNGVVRLHFRPDPTSGPTSGQWAGAQINWVDRKMGYGNYSMEIGGIPVEQTQGEIGIIRAIFLWADQPWLAYLKPGEIFGWPLKEEWRNIQREIDFIEIGKFNNSLHSVAQFAVQHWNVLGNVMPISPNISEAMTYTCEFLKDSITFLLKQAGLETAWRYINQLFIPGEDPGIGVIANIWNSGYKAKDPTTHAPSNGIRQWFDIRSVKLPPANASVTSASPTGAPESRASSAISGGGIAGIAVGGVVGLGVVAGLAYARFRRAAAEPQQPARNASVLNDVVIELPVVAEPQQPARNASPQGHDQVVVELQGVSQSVAEALAAEPWAAKALATLNAVLGLGLDEAIYTEPQPPASEVTTPEHEVVDVAAIQGHAGVASTPVPDDHVGDDELPQTAIEVSPQVTAQAVEGQDV
jgi:hypothetical protein